jgi:hypothetical protein
MPCDRRKVVYAVAAVVAIGLFFAARHFTEPTRNEPIYQGKTLTKWLKQLDDGEAFGISSSRPSSPTQRQLEAAEAIHAMGTNALPCLMEDIHARPTANNFRIRLYRWSKAHPVPYLGLRWVSTDLTEEDCTRWRAAQGLAALGPLAKPALPELKRLLYTNFWHSSIKEAAYALATMGPEGIEVLTNSVQPQTEWSGMCAIWALGQHPGAGTNCIPFLINAATSTSEGTAEGAIEVLGLFHADAAEVVPALTNFLSSPNIQLSQRAARSLGFYGRQAVSALPLLEAMTNNPAVKDAALQALKQIRRGLERALPNGIRRGQSGSLNDKLGSTKIHLYTKYYLTD